MVHWLARQSRHLRHLRIGHRRADDDTLATGLPALGAARAQRHMGTLHNRHMRLPVNVNNEVPHEIASQLVDQIQSNRQVDTADRRKRRQQQPKNPADRCVEPSGVELVRMRQLRHVQPPAPPVRQGPVDPWDDLCATLEAQGYGNGQAGSEVSEFSEFAALIKWLRRQVPGTGHNERDPQDLAAAIADGEVKPHQCLLSEDLENLRQLLRAHIMVLEAKAGIDRGRYSGSPGGKNAMAGHGRDRDTNNARAALAYWAYNKNCTGLFLNLLLERGPDIRPVPEGFLDDTYAILFGGPGQALAGARSARQLYKAVAAGRDIPTRSGPAAGFTDWLWQADNLQEGVAVMRKIVDTEAPPASEWSDEDRVVSALAVELMDAANEYGCRHTVDEVFELCRPWLRHQAAAYTILLYSDAMAYNMPGVVQVLQMMRSEGAMPDAYIWTTIISGMCRHGEVRRAMKLFSMHMLFLPQNNGQSTDASVDSGAMLYAPTYHSSGAGANMWEKWFRAENNCYSIDPFIRSWLYELANRYHCDESSGYGRSSPGARGRGGAAEVVPWLPTLGTHRIMIKQLDKAGLSWHLQRYYRLLKELWPQYRQWVDIDVTNDDMAGFRGLERLVYGHMAEHSDKVRQIYGLESVESGTGIEEAYYNCCDEIRWLANREVSRRSPARLAAAATSTSTITENSPPRIVYAKAIHAFAKMGDIRSILYHMRRHPHLNDIAVWTEVVRCIGVQLLHSPGNQHMLHPQRYASKADDDGSTSDLTWLDFVFELAQTLATGGVHFTQVTFGHIVQIAVQLGDMDSVRRTAKYMYSNSTTRFNTEMLIMVLDMDMPFELKHALARDTLKQAAMHSTVKPIYGLLSRLAKMAETQADAEMTYQLASELHEKHGLVLKAGELDLLRSRCTGPLVDGGETDRS
ncbi:hypothetical protein GGF46_003893 [Coemansia sp. RSA 552]|nr:hypothetical protein GGF46_003893 [Coemansia sp. RSA 552]